MAKHKTPKLRPKKNQNSKVKGGDYALAELLKGELDGRLKVAKQQKQLEAEFIDRAGGPDRLTPEIIVLIQENIVPKTLEMRQRAKSALLGRVCLTDKNSLALSNSLRLDILAFNTLIKENKGRSITPEQWRKTVCRED